MRCNSHLVVLAEDLPAGQRGEGGRHHPGALAIQVEVEVGRRLGVTDTNTLMYGRLQVRVGFYRVDSRHFVCTW